MSREWQWRILIVVSHPIFRETVRYILAADSRLAVIAETDNGEEAMTIIRQIELDIVLIDLHLSGMSGLAVAAALKVDRPHLIILLLSGDWSPAYERQAKAAGIRARLAKQNFCLADIHRVLG